MGEADRMKRMSSISVLRHGANTGIADTSTALKRGQERLAAGTQTSGSERCWPMQRVNPVMDLGDTNGAVGGHRFSRIKDRMRSFLEARDLLLHMLRQIIQK